MVRTPPVLGLGVGGGHVLRPKGSLPARDIDRRIMTRVMDDHLDPDRLFESAWTNVSGGSLGCKFTTPSVSRNHEPSLSAGVERR